MVISVNGGSLAEALGIEANSVIQYVAGQQIMSLDDLSESLRANLGNTIELTWLNKAGDTVVREVALACSRRTRQGNLGS